MVPSHVTWWKGCTPRPVLAKTYLSCYLFCVYYSMFPSHSPSIRTYGHVEIHTTLPAHSKGFSPETTRSSFFYSWRSSFSWVASFKPIIQHYFRLTVYFAAVRGASSSSHLFSTFFFLSIALHRHPIPLGVGWISIIPLRYNDFKWALIIEFVIVVFLLWYAFFWWLLIL